MFLYGIKKIHAAYSKYPGDAWHTYDEVFRRKMQAWPEISWDCQDITGFTETVVPAKDYAPKGELPFRNSWPKKRTDKPQPANKSMLID